MSTGATGHESSNVATLKNAYARWHTTKGGSVDDWMALLADDIKFGSLAGGAAHVSYLTNYDTKQALRSYFDGLAKSWSMIHFTMDEFITQGDVVVVRGNCSWQHKGTGKVCSTPKVDYWRFKDGKAIEYFEYYDTAGVHAAASEEPSRQHGATG
jgi:ketosteroid isomerase-like protein